MLAYFLVAKGINFLFGPFSVKYLSGYIYGRQSAIFKEFPLEDSFKLLDGR